MKDPLEFPYDEAYSPRDRESFSYDTVVKRWPVILTGIIDNLHNAIAALYPSPPTSPPSPPSERIIHGKALLSKISKLKSDMGKDYALEDIPDDGGLDVARYNAALEKLRTTKTKEGKGQETWFGAPWLFAECYLYRLIRAWFALTPHWEQYDPFAQQKEGTFKASGTAVFKLATTMAELEARKDTLVSGAEEEQLHVLFDEMMQMCLWGNATDLSLLPTMSYADIQALQASQAGADAMDKILRNDLERSWERVRGLKGARIDLVLDNAGFELFTDLVLADFLVTFTPYVSKVVFHPKLIPWFVSDVLPTDFRFLLSPTPPASNGLKDEGINTSSWGSFFSSSASSSSPSDPPAPSAKEQADLENMMARWRTHLSNGVFELSIPLDTPTGVPKPDAEENVKDAAFWTGAESYWELAEERGLMGGLEGSGLVIFKGDLNYRKLTRDLKWDPTKPFSEAIGPLSGKCALLSLRTCKADVVVGLEPGVAERLDKVDAKWRVNGKYAVISYDGP